MKESAMFEKRIGMWGLSDEVLAQIPQEFEVIDLKKQMVDNCRVWFTDGEGRRQTGHYIVSRIIIDTPEWFEENQMYVAPADEKIIDMTQFPHAFERAVREWPAHHAYQGISYWLRDIPKESLTEEKLLELLVAKERYIFTGVLELVQTDPLVRSMFLELALK